ncbi:MAG: hypothetical protein PHS57_10110, partial [Alphaproteobacteria bacterium]|nr:hypothetical protein [Alphaproteobacteria bacterium]
MMGNRFLSCAMAIALLGTLAGCGSFRRDHVAEQAKTAMLGLTREEVLACMGPANKRATEGETEVWSYRSTDRLRASASGSLKISGDARMGYGSRSDKFCTVNVVMRGGVVEKVNYLGPSAT